MYRFKKPIYEIENTIYDTTGTVPFYKIVIHLLDTILILKTTTILWCFFNFIELYTWLRTYTVVLYFLGRKVLFFFVGDRHEHLDIRNCHSPKKFLFFKFLSENGWKLQPKTDTNWSLFCEMFRNKMTFFLKKSLK